MRAIIIEHHTLYQDALVSLVSDIAPALQPVGTHQWADQLLQDGDVALIIISATTADRDLVADIRTMQRPGQTIPILLLVEYVDIAAATEAFANGIQGMILKNTSANVLAGAIDMLLQGEVYFPSTLTPPSRSHIDTTAVAGLNTISPRQRDVLDLLATGCSNQDIAQRLEIRESTVKNHIQAIFRSFNVASRTQAVIAAANAGLVLTTPAVSRGK